MRSGVLGVATMALIAIVTPARAADGNRLAYDFAMRCFTANAVAINRSAENPNGTETAAIRAKAAHDYDVVYRMGAVLGFSEAQISAEFNRAQATEARLLTAGPKYFNQTKADCVKLGLM